MSEDLRPIHEINTYVRSLVEQPHVVKDRFWTGGIITQYHRSNLGHSYFTLEDERYSIRCMLAYGNHDKIDFPLAKGLLVDVYGAIRVYDRKAEVQLAVEKMRLVTKEPTNFDPSVIEQLKAQGLYPRQKKALPKPPQHIALVTSKRSEAKADFEDKYKSEGGRAQIRLVDTLVGGERAPQMIADAIERVNQEQKNDVIVLVRGGGRTADLAVFNDIRVAEAICRSAIPVVTGIGHQQDDTIADRVADETTITPTDAGHKLAQLQRYAESTANDTQKFYLYIAIGFGLGFIILLLYIFSQLL